MRLQKMFADNDDSTCPLRKALTSVPCMSNENYTTQKQIVTELKRKCQRLHECVFDYADYYVILYREVALEPVTILPFGAWRHLDRFAIKGRWRAYEYATKKHLRTHDFDDCVTDTIGLVAYGDGERGYCESQVPPVTYRHRPWFEIEKLQIKIELEK